MDVETIRLLIDVARAGSLAAAARERGIDPSQVSRPIALLEAELGVRLLQRSTRVMALTEAGESYVAAVTPLVAGIEAAGEAAARQSHNPIGTVRVTASVAFGETLLAPLLPSFREAFPRLKLELLLTDANLDLVTDRIDIALRLAPSYRADVIGVRLFPTRYHIVASPEYVARHGRPREPEELAERSCALSALPEYRTRWLFRRADATEPEPVFVGGEIVSSNANLLRSAALSGIGPALLADWLVGAALRRGELVDLFPDHEVTATTFDTAAWLLYASREHLPARSRAVIDFLRARLAT